MFQESALFPWLSVIDNIKFGLDIAGFSKQEKERRAMYYLRMVNLEAYRDYAVHQLNNTLSPKKTASSTLCVIKIIVL